MLCKNHPVKGFIFWMPTYRQHKKDAGNNVGTEMFPLGIPVIKREEELIELDFFFRRTEYEVVASYASSTRFIFF